MQITRIINLWHVKYAKNTNYMVLLAHLLQLGYKNQENTLIQDPIAGINESLSYCVNLIDVKSFKFDA